MAPRCYAGLTAFPDLCPNGRIDSVEGSIVHITDEGIGTQTGDLDLRSLGMGIIPATGKSISLPRETGRVTLKGDRVVNLHFDDTPVGGSKAFLPNWVPRRPSLGQPRAATDRTASPDPNRVVNFRATEEARRGD